MYGEIIEKIRLSKNMNMRDFAKLVGSSLAHISRLEKEKSSKGKDKLLPPIDLLKQICDRSGYPFRQFLEESEYIDPVIAAPAIFEKYVLLSDLGKSNVDGYINKIYYEENKSVDIEKNGNKSSIKPQEA